MIKTALESYEEILLNYDKSVVYDKNPKLVVKGGVNLMSKSSFVDSDIPHINFEKALASSIVFESINKYIPSSFTIAQTEKYLIYKENILETLSSILTNKTDEDDIIIIGFNISYELREILEISDTVILYKDSTQHYFKDVLFILNKKDLPRIYKKEIKGEEFDENKLNEISPDLKLYSSVLELNKNPEIKMNWINAGYNKEDIESEPKVQVMLSFIWLLLWKKDRRIIQISVSDPSLEQGDESTFDDISPI